MYTSVHAVYVKYNKIFVIHNLGTHYPDATGYNPDNEDMLIEESGKDNIPTHLSRASRR